MTKWKEQFKVWQDVFDRFTMNNIKVLVNKGVFEELKGSIAVGKESNVFYAVTGDNDIVVVKIYRLQTADFNRMYFYIRNDPRFEGLTNKRRKVILAWCQREFRNLINAERAGVRVPKPIAFYKNVLVMEFIGDEQPAPKIKDLLPDKKLIKKFADKVFDYIEKFAAFGFVHGDLSEFNILNYHNEPVFIDLSHATPTRNPDSLEYLRRDINNTCRFFNKALGTSDKNVYDPGEIFNKVLEKIPTEKLP